MKTTELHDDTDWGALIRSLDFSDEIEAAQREALEEVVDEAARTAPRVSGAFAEGFKEPDAVSVRREGQLIVGEAQNQTAYAGHIHRPGAPKRYLADELLYEPAEEAAVDATVLAITRVLEDGINGR